MPITFIRDYTELTRAAERVSEDNAAKAHEEAKSGLKVADEAAQAARDKTRELSKRRFALGDLLMREQTTGTAYAVHGYEAAIASDSIDLKELTTRAVETRQQFAFLRDTLAYLDSDVLPQARIDQQKAETATTLAKADCLMSESVLLAIRKNAALQALIAVDGEAAVVPAGRAWEAFTESLQWHERAAREEAAVEAAEATLTTRRNGLKGN